MIVKAHFYIVQNSQVIEQTNVLEGSCNTMLVDINGFLAGNILSVQQNITICGLIYTCQQVEYGCFSGTVRSNESVELSLLNIQVEIIYCTQSAEGNAQITYFQ